MGINIANGHGGFRLGSGRKSQLIKPKKTTVRLKCPIIVNDFYRCLSKSTDLKQAVINRKAIEYTLKRYDMIECIFEEYFNNEPDLIKKFSNQEERKSFSEILDDYPRLKIGMETLKKPTNITLGQKSYDDLCEKMNVKKSKEKNGSVEFDNAGAFSSGLMIFYLTVHYFASQGTDEVSKYGRKYKLLENGDDYVFIQEAYQIMKEFLDDSDSDVEYLEGFTNID